MFIITKDFIHINTIIKNNNSNLEYTIGLFRF